MFPNTVFMIYELRAINDELSNEEGGCVDALRCACKIGRASSKNGLICFVGIVDHVASMRVYANLYNTKRNKFKKE